LVGIFKCAQCEPEVLIGAVIYLEKFLDNTKLSFSLWNWQKILFICILVSSKCWDDLSCKCVNGILILFRFILSSKSFQKCCRHTMSQKEINEMERVMLSTLNYDLYVSTETYGKYYYNLKKFWVNLAFDKSVY
jgi:hypothetical protein